MHLRDEALNHLGFYLSKRPPIRPTISTGFNGGMNGIWGRGVSPQFFGHIIATLPHASSPPKKFREYAYIPPMFGNC